ncbi:hypothetical protein [Sandaracinus amylolyticus]|uniref:hypothetical protein n=1 Tax=Sandaracinus amylolyticus TaxID=927083 RepID=UPI001F1F4D31|nr:hypothetical protein [Sandaracinus amylolyticus]UJR79317.1 Hypothetical protein I5071_13530 [Sandaracinus amylolyticus]
MQSLGQLDGEVGRWLDTYDRDVRRAFEECRRGDWLVRIAMSVGVARPLVVIAAADAASIAIKRTRPSDLRPGRAVLTATKWARGECGPADAWAAAFAATQAAEDIAKESVLVSEAALAAAAACFACDPRADDAYYAQRAYAAQALDHAVRAFGTEAHVGRQRCLEATRERITLDVLASAVSRASVLPPAR